MNSTKSVWKWLFGAVLLIALYGYLAGGGVWDFLAAMCIVPFAAFILLGVYTPSAGEVVDYPDYKPSKWGDGLFWLLVAYFCLPPIMNGLSKFLWFLAFEDAEGPVFSFRYWIMVILVLIVVTCGLVIDVWQRSRSRQPDIPSI